MARIAEDKDFDYLKTLVDESEGWMLELDKADTKVWTRPIDGCSFQMVKIQTVFPDISSETLYDVLHDPDYRRVWDTNCLESLEIGLLNVNNDVGYYASEYKFDNYHCNVIKIHLETKTWHWHKTFRFSLSLSRFENFQCHVHPHSNLETLCFKEAGLILDLTANKCCWVGPFHTKIFHSKKATSGK